MRPNKKRKQRHQKWIEEQLHEEGWRNEPSEGQFWVLDLETGEKTPGLNLKQAKELWRTLKRAMYFSMDTYKAGVAPLKALFNAGKPP